VHRFDEVARRQEHLVERPYLAWRKCTLGVDWVAIRPEGLSIQSSANGGTVAQVDGEVINTVKAIWTEDPKELSDEQYKDFYKFVANAYDDPVYR
jgi:HSP90 family molecular chaperone